MDWISGEDDTFFQMGDEELSAALRKNSDTWGTDALKEHVAAWGGDEAMADTFQSLI
jgi:hypothetical protein